MNVALMVGAGLVALAWSALAIRLLALSRGKWFRFLQPTTVERSTYPSVEAVIPARNEEAHIRSTVEGLRGQSYPRLTLTIVDDQSTDATASILEELADRTGSAIPIDWVQGSERPEGWVGKTWAVHQGARDSTADWLWFVDADMGLHPRSLATAIEEAEAAGADLVSFLPGVRCRSFWQGAIASSFLQLLGHLYPLDRVNDPTRAEAIAAGGFLLIRRSTYEQVGGHESVRREIVEDIQLARRVKATGGKILVRLAPDLAWTHMYGRFAEIWRGLRKNAYAGMDYLPHKYVTGALIALGLAWMPWLALVVGLIQGATGTAILGAWGVLAQAAASAPILVFLRLPAGFALTLPLGISAYVAIATSSVWHHHRGRILWKDRAISSSMVASPGRDSIR